MAIGRRESSKACGADDEEVEAGLSDLRAELQSAKGTSLADQAVQGRQLGRGLEVQGRRVRAAIELARSEGRGKRIRHSAWSTR